MSKPYNDTLSTKIRTGNSTTAEDSLADAAPALLAACRAFVDAFAGNKASQLGNGVAFRCYLRIADEVAKIDG